MRYKLMVSGWGGFDSYCDGWTNTLEVAEWWKESVRPYSFRFYLDTQK